MVGCSSLVVVSGDSLSHCNVQGVSSLFAVEALLSRYDVREAPLSLWLVAFLNCRGGLHSCCSREEGPLQWRLCLLLRLLGVGGLPSEGPSLVLALGVPH